MIFSHSSTREFMRQSAKRGNNWAPNFSYLWSCTRLSHSLSSWISIHHSASFIKFIEIRRRGRLSPGIICGCKLNTWMATCDFKLIDFVQFCGGCKMNGKTCLFVLIFTWEHGKPILMNLWSLHEQGVNE